MDSAEEVGAFFITFLGTKAGGEKAEADATKKAVAATENFMVAFVPMVTPLEWQFTKMPTTKILWSTVPF
jgi:hypothetical protein